MDLVCAPQQFGCDLGQANRPDFPLPNQVGQGAHGVLNRSFRISPVHVIKVDGFYAQPLQRVFATLAHVGSRIVDIPVIGTALRTGRVTHYPKFAGQGNTATLALEKLRQQLLVMAPALHVRRVVMHHTELKRPLQRPHRLRIVALTVKLGHAHAAQANEAAGQTRITNLDGVHVISPIVR